MCVQGLLYILLFKIISGEGFPKNICGCHSDVTEVSNLSTLPLLCSTTFLSPRHLPHLLIRTISSEAAIFLGLLERQGLGTSILLKWQRRATQRDIPELFNLLPRKLGS